MESPVIRQKGESQNVTPDKSVGKNVRYWEKLTCFVFL